MQGVCKFYMPLLRVEESTRLQEMLTFLADGVLRTRQSINNPCLTYGSTLLFVLGKTRFHLRIKVCDALLYDID
jgi:hypothetical protein